MGKNRKKCDASLSLIWLLLGSRETLNGPDLLGKYHVRPDDIKYMMESLCLSKSTLSISSIAFEISILIWSTVFPSDF